MARYYPQHHTLGKSITESSIHISVMDHANLLMSVMDRANLLMSVMDRVYLNILVIKFI